MIGVIIPLAQTCTPKDADEMHDGLTLSSWRRVLSRRWGRRFRRVRVRSVRKRTAMTASMVLEFDERPPSMNGGHGSRHAKATMKRHWRNSARSRCCRYATIRGVAAGRVDRVVTAQQLSRNRAGRQDLGNGHEAVKAVIDGIVDTA